MPHVIALYQLLMPWLHLWGWMQPHARWRGPYMNPLKRWMAAASPAEQEQLAAAAGTSRAMLYQYSSPESTNRRPSAAKGALLAAASVPLHEASDGRLPVLTRGDLVEACASCEHFRACQERKQ